MTVISAPRITPRIVSSLIFSPARRLCPCVSRVAAPVAILFSRIDAGARRSGCRMTADRLPAPIVLYPDVTQDHAILDASAKIFEPPARLDCPDHHVVEHGCVVDLHINVLHVAALDGVEPFGPAHGERPRRAGPNQ